MAVRKVVGGEEHEQQGRDGGNEDKVKNIEIEEEEDGEENEGRWERRVKKEDEGDLVTKRVGSQLFHGRKDVMRERGHLRGLILRFLESSERNKKWVPRYLKNSSSRLYEILSLLKV